VHKHNPPANFHPQVMPMVIKFFAYIRDYTHTKETRMDGCGTMEELLQKLCSVYGRKFEERVFKDGVLSEEIIILINGRHLAHFNGLQTELGAEDEISIFPVVAGG
jgi:molybdopterin synthase sulfur carrier subunit